MPRCLVARAALTLAFALGASATYPGQNLWTPLGPDAPFAAAIAVDPFEGSTVYAGLIGPTSLGTLFKSTDDGESWASASEGLPSNRSVTDLVASPQTSGLLYAVLSGVGLFRSTDGAGTWTQIGEGLTDVQITVLRLAPSDPVLLYAATPSGLFASVDGGTTFSLRNDSVALSALDVDPTDPARLLAGTNDAGAMISTDGGETLTPVDDSLDADQITDIRFAPASSQVAYASAGFEHVYATVDGGTSWSQKIFPLARFASVVRVDPVDSQRVYAGAVAGLLFASVDGGDNWSQAIADPSGTSIRALAIDGEDSSTLYAASPAGVSRSNDGGATWSRVSSGLRFSRLERVVVDPVEPARLWAVSQSIGLHRSVDAGAAWIPFPTDAGTTVYDLDYDPVDPTVLYQTSSTRVWRSVDSGESWARVDDGLESTGPRDLAIDPLDSTTLYVATTAGVFRSTDAAGTWTQLAGGLPDAVFLRVVLAPSQPSVLYVNPLNQGLFSSADGGDSWSDRSQGLPDLRVVDIAVDPLSPLVVYAGTRGGVVRSEDGGASWSEVLLRPGAIRSLVVDPLRPGVLYVAGSSGLFGSADAGASWHRLDDDIPGVSPFRITVSPGRSDRLFLASSGDSAFARDLVPGLVIEADDDLETTESGGAVSFRVRLATLPTDPVSLPLRSSDPGEGSVDPTSLVFTPADAFAAQTVTVTGVDDAAPDGTVGYRIELGPAESSDPFYADLESDSVTVSNRDDEVVAPGICMPGSTTLCLDDLPGDRRFRVEMSYVTTLGGGSSGDALAVPLAELGITRGGILYFFGVDNPEVLVKVLNGCGINGHYWIFFAATTTLGFELTVEDTVAGDSKVYRNIDRQAALPVTDVEAFDTCR